MGLARARPRRAGGAYINSIRSAPRGVLAATRVGVWPRRPATGCNCREHGRTDGRIVTRLRGRTNVAGSATCLKEKREVGRRTDINRACAARVTYPHTKYNRYL